MSNLIYPATNLKVTEKLKIDHAEGIYIYDSDGKEYIEGMSGLWCTSLGYNNRELIEAANEQMSKLTYSHMFGGKTHQIGIDLADNLSKLVPIKNAKVFFGNSGSDANDTNLKMLRYYFNSIGQPQKYKVIARERSYHGVTVATSALTGLAINHAQFNLPIEALGVLRTDAPHYSQGKLEGESEDSFVDRIIENLEKLIISEDPKTIAAFIAEPITGASGVIVPPEGYYQKVQKVLDKYNILFWADEVITAFGRTGKDFGCTTMGIQNPKIMTLAKQLSSAYFPISASVISDEQYHAIADTSEKLGVFGHGYTYSGHPVGCAVALKTLEIYDRDNLFRQAEILGQYLQNSLQQLCDHPLVGEIRGKGLIAAIELSSKHQGEFKFDGAKAAAYTQKSCEKNGLILRVVAGSSIAICPPLITTIDQIDSIIHIIVKSLDETLDWVVRH